VIGYNKADGCGRFGGLECTKQVPYNLVMGRNNAPTPGSGGIVSGSNNILDGNLAVCLVERIFDY
jgi:hypothetical protein